MMSHKVYVYGPLALAVVLGFSGQRVHAVVSAAPVSSTTDPLKLALYSDERCSPR